jgi:5-methylcytosine-specific restriction endonuclease McrA
MRQRINYEQYINSPQWRAKRKALLRKLKPYCRGCYSKQNLQVHHLSYFNLGRESVKDCTVLCEKCHERVTARCRQARKALIFRRSIASVTWREVAKIRQEKGRSYKPKPKSLGRIAWELLR